MPVAAPLAAAEPALLRLAERLRRLGEDGLDPAAYAIPDEALARRDAAAWRAALAEAARRALEDLLHGRVRALPGRADLRRSPETIPLDTWLAELAATDEPAAVLDRAALLHSGMVPLKAALARARAAVAAGGWGEVPGTATIEPGAEDPVRVPALRARLLATDPELAAAPDAGPLYDPALVAAVRRFQAARGLEADGRVGRHTLAALNRPAEAELRQLRVALDMRRGAPPPERGRRIEVNIPDQRLQVIEDGRPLLEMAVIVGRPSRPTPTLVARLTAVQFNPPWGVPQRNAREDLLPRFRQDPRAMMEKGFRIFGMVDGQRVELDPMAIDWKAVRADHFPYVVRQDPGEANALGRLKFILPNREDIFLHDTPERHLFRRAERAFSSGCVRLERPMELLALALEGTPGWDPAQAARQLDSRETRIVALARDLPVRLHYTTVVIERGEIRMRSDLYGLDEAYARALDAPRPRLAGGQRPDGGWR
ncbi:L,D-transpeptidase family protein [Crenalkalicoccus roseus]|uniref:L,D-transpeptidase family protein n=1 Tax=Crenalkalicoccus roseus TaxID=1485588 RepID=UPI001081B6E1|nr:L,D-transpeptidase family protein [Crenalkalicoccus roseus]